MIQINGLKTDQIQTLLGITKKYPMLEHQESPLPVGDQRVEVYDEKLKK